MILSSLGNLRVLLQESEKNKSKSQYNVITIDDSLADQYLVESMLSESKTADFKVSHFDTIQALQHSHATLNEINPHVVMLNMSATLSSKFQISEIRTILPDTPIVVMVEFFSEEVSKTLGEFGAIRVIPKTNLTTVVLVNDLVHTLELYQTFSKRFKRANFDDLTGLANRSMLKERVNHAIDLSKRSDNIVALLIIDLDDFKLVNDHYGHDIGDMFLISIAKRLEDCVRETDTVSRLGGDEFAIVLEGVDHPEKTVTIAKKILSAIKEPVLIRGKKITPSLSIGVSYLKDLNKSRFSYDWLYRSADNALYEAKKDGKNTYSVFTEQHDNQMIHALEIEDELTNAILEKNFTLHYQPIFDVNTQKLVAAEALVRFKNKKGKLLGPEQFLGVLEKLGLMKELGDYVIENALTQFASWREAGLTDMSIHINVSPAQFLNAGFYDHLSEHIDQLAIPANQIELELTEQTLFKNSKFLEREFIKLDFIGVNIAIDDFGTGYNSFEYLNRFQFNTIKLDKSFVQANEDCKMSRAVLELMANFAKKINVSAVAEGVETPQQMSLIKSLGIQQVQGHFTARPMSAEHFTALYCNRQSDYALMRSKVLNKPTLVSI